MFLLPATGKAEGSAGFAGASGSTQSRGFRTHTCLHCGGHTERKVRASQGRRWGDCSADPACSVVPVRLRHFVYMQSRWDSIPALRDGGHRGGRVGSLARAGKPAPPAPTSHSRGGGLSESLQRKAGGRLTVGEAGPAVLAQRVAPRAAARVGLWSRVAEVLAPVQPQRVAFVFS